MAAIGFLVSMVSMISLSSASQLMDTLLDEFLDHARNRSVTLQALGTDTAGWKARQQETNLHLAELFAPLPTPDAVPVPYNITGELHHPSGFTIKKILYQTR